MRTRAAAAAALGVLVVAIGALAIPTLIEGFNPGNSMAALAMAFGLILLGFALLGALLAAGVWRGSQGARTFAIAWVAVLGVYGGLNAIYVVNNLRFLSPVAPVALALGLVIAAYAFFLLVWRWRRA